MEGVFARSLRSLRGARKWSQARLAAEVAERRGLNLDPTAITRIERGQRGVSLSEAVAIAAVLGASVDEMCMNAPGADERALRLELAAAEAEIANAEANLASAQYVYAELSGRVAALQKKLEELATDAEPQEAPDALSWMAVRDRPPGGGS